MERAEDKTILVVEDEPNVNLYLMTLLEDAGFNVITAADGEEGLRLAQEKRPDFISLDLVLPKKSGRRLLRDLKKDKDLSKIPVLIVTAHAKDELGKEQLDDILENVILDGPGLYMEKPVNPLNYIRCIQRALGVEESKDATEKIDLKDQLRGLLQDAGPDKLRKALEALQKG